MWVLTASKTTRSEFEGREKTFFYLAVPRRAEQIGFWADIAVTPA